MVLSHDLDFVEDRAVRAEVDLGLVDGGAWNESGRRARACRTVVAAGPVVVVLVVAPGARRARPIRVAAVAGGLGRRAAAALGDRGLVLDLVFVLVLAGDARRVGDGAAERRAVDQLE